MGRTIGTKFSMDQNVNALTVGPQIEWGFLKGGELGGLLRQRGDEVGADRAADAAALEDESLVRLLLNEHLIQRHVAELVHDDRRIGAESRR